VPTPWSQKRLAGLVEAAAQGECRSSTLSKISGGGKARLDRMNFQHGSRRE
jgi:hypothetical protein